MHTTMLDRTHDGVGALDVVAYDDRYEILVDVPGVLPGDLEVTTVGGELVISGVRRHGREGDDAAQATHRFKRRLTLAGEIDRDAIVASLNNGVLRIAVPRSGFQRKRIPVGAGRLADRGAHSRERIRLPWQAPARKAGRQLRRSARSLLQRARRR